jgi:cell wall-associated NlpC family hydrolase
MRWFFASKENQDKLKKEMREWIGTPFRHYAGVKQAGADCIHFVLTVYENVGAVKDALHFLPRYGHDWCHHTTEQKLYNGLKRHKSFIESGYTDPRNGDVLLYQFGKAASHCGIYFDKSVYQAIDGSGVCRIYYKDKAWARRLRFGFRIKNG